MRSNKLYESVSALGSSQISKLVSKKRPQSLYESRSRRYVSRLIESTQVYTDGPSVYIDTEGKLYYLGCDTSSDASVLASSIESELSNGVSPDKIAQDLGFNFK